MENRNVVLKGLAGSHNYNLGRTEDVFSEDGTLLLKASDMDYKVYVTPTFEELYNNQKFQKTIVNHTDGNDYDMHDIRKLPELFFKSNLNYLEILYSKDVFINGYEISQIFRFRNEIFNMNLPALFKSCGGTFLNKMKLLPKGTEGTQYLVDLHGFDTKQALHAYRNLHFPVRYAETDFTDVEYALRYEGEDLEFAMEIISGKMSQENFERFARFYHDSRFVHVKEKYLAQPVNWDLKNNIDESIMRLVKREIFN